MASDVQDYGTTTTQASLYNRATLLMNDTTLERIFQTNVAFHYRVQARVWLIVATIAIAGLSTPSLMDPYFLATYGMVIPFIAGCILVLIAGFVSTFVKPIHKYYQVLTGICTMAPIVFLLSWASILTMIAGDPFIIMTGLISGPLLRGYYWITTPLSAALYIAYAVIQSQFADVTGTRVAEIFFCSLLGSTVGAGLSYVNELLHRKAFIGWLRVEMENKQVQESISKNEEMLRVILPNTIAVKLRSKQQQLIADLFPSASVLFITLDNVETAVEMIISNRKHTPADSGTDNGSALLSMLNELFSMFDVLVMSTKGKVEKIKTIGYTYMAISGVPIAVEDHASQLMKLTLKMIAAVQNYNHKKKTNLVIKGGIATGSVVAGVIGRSRFSFDIWSDCVNVASRMMSTGVSGRIQVDKQTYESLKDTYEFEERGEIYVKGKGEMPVFLVIDPFTIHRRSQTALVGIPFVKVPSQRTMNSPRISTSTVQDDTMILHIPRRSNSSQVIPSNDSSPATSHPNLLRKSSKVVVVDEDENGEVRDLEEDRLQYGEAAFKLFKNTAQTMETDTISNEQLTTDFSNMPFLNEQVYQQQEKTLQAQIKSFVLWFKDPLNETKWREQFLPRNIGLGRSFLLASGLFFSLMTAADIMENEYKPSSWFPVLIGTRLGFSIPFTAVLLLLTFAKSLRKHLSKILLINVIVYSLMTSLLPLYDPNNASARLDFVRDINWVAAIGFCAVSVHVDMLAVILIIYPSAAIHLGIYLSSANDERTMIYWIERGGMYAITLVCAHILASGTRKFLRRTFLLKEKNKELKRQLENEKKQAERLLRNILPQDVLQKVMNIHSSSTKTRLIADVHENVTILTADLVNFTTVAGSLQPTELVSMLNDMFYFFDMLAKKYGVFKVKTLGDAYICVCGLPKQRKDHALRITMMALAMQEYFLSERMKQLNIKCRIGIHSGRVVAGIIGVTRYFYDIWGNDVHTTEQLEILSSPDRVLISQATHDLITAKSKSLPLGDPNSENEESPAYKRSMDPLDSIISSKSHTAAEARSHVAWHQESETPTPHMNATQAVDDLTPTPTFGPIQAEFGHPRLERNTDASEYAFDIEEAQSIEIDGQIVKTFFVNRCTRHPDF